MTQILILLIFTFCIGESSDSTITDLYEDENLKVEIVSFSKANIIDRNWLSLSFLNKSNDTIEIKDFSYRTEYDTLSFELGETRKNSLGQGNKFDVFPVFEAKRNPSEYDAFIKPKENIVGYRSVSNYASVLLGYDNKTNLNIHSKIIAKCKYILNGKEIEFETESPEFKFIWSRVNREYLPNRFIETCDSIYLRGNYWIISSLAKDTSVTNQIPESTFVKLITQRVEDSFSTRRDIIAAFVKHYKTNNAVNEFYINELQKPNTIIFRDLDYYWHSSLLEPLTKSFKQNNKNHYQYLKLLDKHHDLWEDNSKLKTELYDQIKEYAYQVLVSNKNLSSNNKSGWQSWINQLKMTHSNEAEEYFKTFFKNDLPLFEEKNNPMKFYSNAPPYYPASRACDAALEAFIYSKYGDVTTIYTKKLNELVSKGKLKKSTSNKRYLIRNADLLNKEKMQTIRNELLKDYR